MIPLGVSGHGVIAISITTNPITTLFILSASQSAEEVADAKGGGGDGRLFGYHASPVPFPLPLVGDGCEPVVICADRRGSTTLVWLVGGVVDRGSRGRCGSCGSGVHTTTTISTASTTPHVFVITTMAVLVIILVVVVVIIVGVNRVNGVMVISVISVRLITRDVRVISVSWVIRFTVFGPFFMNLASHRPLERYLTRHLLIVAHGVANGAFPCGKVLPYSGASVEGTQGFLALDEVGDMTRDMSVLSPNYGAVR